ncbi:MAG: hypothetical protein EHM40_23205, partial [Chloroflexi bacterium]
MKRRLSLPFLAASLLLLSVLNSAHAQTFYASNSSRSDYYVYFTWSEGYNACWTWPWSEYHIKLSSSSAGDICAYTYPATASTTITWPAYTGSDYYYALGPGQSSSFYAWWLHHGWSCNYGSNATINGSTSNIYAPGALTATMDGYDNQVLLKWGASSTHVPSGSYQYRIYRDGVLIATVGSGVLSHPDYAAVPGVTYRYEVEAYAPAWNNSSTRQAANGRAFNLNVSTESLEDGGGVRISWDSEHSDSMNYQRFTIERKDGNKPPEYLNSINSPTATSWTDAYTTAQPWPGYTYTYIVTPDNAAGTSYRPDSAQGANTSNGSISGYIRAPVGGGGVQSVLITVTRLDTVAQGGSRWTFTDTTDANGY